MQWSGTVILLCSLQGRAQQVNVTSVTPNPICAGAAITATYSYTLPDPGNVVLYLNGPNTTNLLIGSATTNGNNGSVTGVIPADRATGAYTVFIRRTSNILPTPINSPASSAFTVNALPAAPGVAPVSYYLGETGVPPLTATGQNLKWYNVSTGGVGTTVAPTPSTSSAGTTNYYVSQTSAAGCEGPRATLAVTINPRPAQVNVTSITPNPVCAGAAITATYSYTLPDPGNVVLYLNGPNTTNLLIGSATTNGNNGSVTGVIPADRATGAYTVFIRRTSNILPTPINSPASSAFTVNALPAAPGVAPVSYCLGETGVPPLTATGQNLKWYNVSTGGVGTTVAPTPSTSSPGTTNYYVSQTSAAGCEGPRATLAVTINPRPAQPTIISSVSYCQNSTAPSLTSSVTSGSNLKWYATLTGGNGSTVAPTPATGSPGQTTYYVSQTNGNGCESDRAAITVTIKAGPAAPAVIPPVIYCQGQTATPLSATPVSGASLNWFGPANNSLGSTAPTPPTSAPGTTFYSVSQTFSGCTGPVTTISVTINAKPVVPTTTPVGVCQGTTPVSLATGVTSGSNLRWYTTSTGGTGSTVAPTPSTGSVGSTPYYLSQVNSNGCESDRAVITYTVSPLPTVSLGNDGPLRCTKPTVLLNATGQGDGVLTYRFSPAASQVGGTSTATVTTAGVYSVTVITAAGCSATASTTVESNTASPNNASLTSGTLTCTQTSLTLTASSTGGASYTLSDGQINRDGQFVVSRPGMYIVTVSGNNGCTSTATATVTSNTVRPVASLSASSPTACAPASGPPTAITLTAGGGTSYTFSAGATRIGQTNQAIVTQSGTYSVTVSNASGCTATASTSVTVNPTPAAPTLTSVSRTVDQSNTPLPLGQFVKADTGNTLSFSGVNGALANPPTADVSQVGVQSFSVSQSTASGCVSGETVFTVQAVTPTNQTVCRSSRVVLGSLTTGVRYEWYKNGQSAPFKLTEIASIQRGTATSSLTLVSVQTTASYYVKVFQANNSFTVDGPFAVTVNYDCTAPGARLAAFDASAPAEVVEADLRIVLLPNPLTNGRLRAVINGAEGQPLTVELLDLRGRPLHQQQWETAVPAQTVDWDVSGQPVGVYLLRAVSRGASGISQRQTLNVLKSD